MKIKIEKNVPIKRSGSGRRPGEVVYPFKDMKVGDSFKIRIKAKYKKINKVVYQQSSIKTLARLWCNYNELKWKFTTRRMGHFIRIWRIK